MAINIGGNTVKNKSDGGKVIYNGKECTEVWYRSSLSTGPVKVWPEDIGYAYLTFNSWSDYDISTQISIVYKSSSDSYSTAFDTQRINSYKNPYSTYCKSRITMPFDAYISTTGINVKPYIKYWTLECPDGTIIRYDGFEAMRTHVVTFNQKGEYILNAYWDIEPEPEEKKYYIDVICYPSTSYTNQWTLTSGKEPVYEKDVTSVYSAKFPGCSAKRYKTELGMKMSVKAPILTDKVLTTMKSTTTWGSWPGPGSDSNWSDRGTNGFDVIISDNPNREVDDYQGILYVVKDNKQYTITASSDTNSIITPNGKTTVKSGASQSYTIKPCSGYKIKDVKIDNVSKGAITNYTFSNVTANHTISVTAEAIKYDVYINAMGGLERSSVYVATTETGGTFNDNYGSSTKFISWFDFNNVTKMEFYRDLAYYEGSGTSTINIVHNGTTTSYSATSPRYAEDFGKILMKKDSNGWYAEFWCGIPQTTVNEKFETIRIDALPSTLNVDTIKMWTSGTSMGVTITY